MMIGEKVAIARGELDQKRPVHLSGRDQFVKNTFPSSGVI